MHAYNSPFAIVQNITAGMQTSSQTQSKTNIKTRITLCLMQAIDETLERTFGKKTLAQIYRYLELRTNLNRNEIPTRPESLSKSMSALFGSTSKLIEFEIAKSLYRKLRVEFQRKENFAIVDYVAFLENSLQR